MAAPLVVAQDVSLPEHKLEVCWRAELFNMLIASLSARSDGELINYISHPPRGYTLCRIKGIHTVKLNVTRKLKGLNCTALGFFLKHNFLMEIFKVLL